MDDLKIVFSDVDGTLLDSRQEITPRTLRALKLLQKKEIPFVIISARSPSGIEPIVRILSGTGLQRFVMLHNRIFT